MRKNINLKGKKNKNCSFVQTIAQSKPRYSATFINILGNFRRERKIQTNPTGKNRYNTNFKCKQVKKIATF